LSTTTSEVYGEDISVTLDGSPIDVELSFDSTGEASFTALQEGAYVFTVIYAGEPYTASVTVSDETTYTEEIKMWTATITVTGSSQLQLQPLAILRNGIQVGTSQFNASGTATVIVHEAGSYTFEADYDSYTYSSDAVSVVAETIYSTSITVFVATLSISTSSIELYGQTISIELDGDVVATTAFSSSGSASIRVHATGDYTCSCVYAGETYSDSVTVSSETTYPVQIDTIPEGSTVLPTDDIQTWLKCAGIRDKAYTTLSEVLADHDTLYLLMGNDNAVDYLVRSTTWVSGITADETAMRYIGKWNYASSALLDASAWETGILASTYKDYIINAKIPTMTSDTTPSGVASFKGGAADDNRKAWKAFDGNTGHAANQTATSALTYQDDDYIQYQFATETKITNGRIQWINANPANTFKTLMVDVSTDGTNFTEIYRSDISQGTLDYSFTTTAGSALYVRAHQIGGRWGGGDNRMCIDQLQLWGRQDVTEGIDIYGAASDTMTVTGDGITLTITTDSSGHYIVPKTSLPNGTYTFTSGVAKDPTNLSNDYSKTVTITDGTSEVYVMPDGEVLYWWGYRHNIEDTSTANGWTTSTSGYTYVPVEYNSNNVLAKSTGGSQYSGIGTSQILPSAYQNGTAVAIGKKTGGTDFGLRGFNITSKTVNISGSTDFVISATSITKVSAQCGTYVQFGGQNGRNGEIYALYVEEA
jgi:hypothetical protein